MIQLRLLQTRLFRTTLTVSFFGSAGFIVIDDEVDIGWDAKDSILVGD